MNRAKPRVTKVLLARRARALKRHLKEAAEGDATGVHHARVASRRLREAIPVVSAGITGAKTTKALRKIRRLTRALGTVREMDVTLKVLDELSAREDLPPLALEAVRVRVVDDRGHRKTTMLRRLGRINVDRLDRRLSALGDMLDRDAGRWRAELSARLLKRAKALGSAMTAAGHVYSVENLHVVRIAAKKLRYALEIAAETGTAQAVALVRTLKRTQNVLGRLHDLQVLQTYVAAVEAAPTDRVTPASGLGTIAQVLEDECRHLHGRYIAATPGLNDIADAARTVIAPQLVRSSATRRRPVKMALREPAIVRPKQGTSARAGGSVGP